MKNVWEIIGYWHLGSDSNKFFWHDGDDCIIKGVTNESVIHRDTISQNGFNQSQCNIQVIYGIIKEEMNGYHEEDYMIDGLLFGKNRTSYNKNSSLREPAYPRYDHTEVEN